MSVGRPIAVYGDCQFVVRWRTGYACPRKPSTFLPIFFWVLVSVGIYLVAAFYYNIRFRLARRPAWESRWEIRVIGAAAIMLVEQVRLIWSARCCSVLSPLIGHSTIDVHVASESRVADRLSMDLSEAFLSLTCVLCRMEELFEERDIVILKAAQQGTYPPGHYFTGSSSIIPR
eukprot:749319-Hanusia_phi.AAC.2